MPDSPLFIAIVIIACIISILLILNIIIQLISIIKEKKFKTEEVKDECKKNRSDEIRYTGNDDDKNSDCLSGGEFISTKSSKEAEESSEVDE